VVVDGGGGGVVAFGVEKEGKTDDDEDRDNGKGIGSYCDASEKVCGCTFARYQNCFLTLTPKRIHSTLASVAVLVIVKMIVVAI
jgi:hypothetical protein